MSDDIVKALLDTMTAEQKAELLNNLMGSLKEDAPVEPAPKQEEVVSSVPHSNVDEDFRVVNNKGKQQRKSPVRAKKNQWRDSGEDRDPNFDPTLYEKMGKAPRNRARAKKRNVECSVCGKSFSVNQSLVYGEYFRCNRCTGR